MMMYCSTENCSGWREWQDHSQSLRCRFPSSSPEDIDNQDIDGDEGDDDDQVIDDQVIDDGDDPHDDEQEEDLNQQPGHLASAEREIERFERKFILPLQSSLVIISTVTYGVRRKA